MGYDRERLRVVIGAVFLVADEQVGPGGVEKAGGVAFCGSPQLLALLVDGDNRALGLTRDTLVGSGF